MTPTPAPPLAAPAPVRLRLAPEHLPLLHRILEHGVGIETLVNVSVSDLLYDGLGLSDDDVQSVQTVFLDCKPVDDLHAALVKDNSTVALSAAMPGLMGATMRRGGTYASLRSSISHAADVNGAPPPAPGRITLKLFNHMLNRLASRFLERGVLVPGEVLAGVLAALDIPATAELKGRSIDLAKYELGLPESTSILLTVAASA